MHQVWSSRTVSGHVSPPQLLAGDVRDRATYYLAKPRVVYPVEGIGWLLSWSYYHRLGGRMRLEEEIGALLRARGLTLATAESCTGGLVGHRITNVPGSSRYYLGGFVAYANEMKESLLGVRHETLAAHGSVSEETAREMARGARRRSGADVAIAVTGVAGPGGGSLEKPVGLVYVALSTSREERCQHHVWEGDRQANKEQSAEAALGLLRSYLKGQQDAPVIGPQRKPVLAFINEPVSVKLREHRGTTLLPTAFVWRGRRFEIDSWGRQSAKVQGGQPFQCHLVQTADRQTWELCQDEETAQWTLTRHWAERSQLL